jgi:hypothetical protein
MGLSNLNALSIAELVIYAPLTVIACAVSIRHGFHPLKGWIFLFIFCALHIVGAALNLATINSPMVITFVTVPIELFAIGQVVIIYVILGVLARVADSINKERPTTLKALYIHLLRIPFIAGIILVIIGTDASNATWSTTGIYRHICRPGADGICVYAAPLSSGRSFSSPLRHHHSLTALHARSNHLLTPDYFCGQRGLQPYNWQCRR